MKQICIMLAFCLTPVFCLAQNYSGNLSNMTSNESRPASISAEEIQNVSYMLGYSFGQYIKGNNMGALYIDQIVKGIKEAVADIEVDEDSFYQIMNDYMEKRAAVLLEANKAAEKAFFAENISNYGVVSTPSGLQYKIVRRGNGIKPGPQDDVTVNYEGKLLDGTVFDSSYERNEPATFNLENVIKGWSEGIQHCEEGGKIIIWIPAELAYGDKGAGSKIGPGATVCFTVELLSVSKP